MAIVSQDFGSGHGPAHSFRNAEMVAIHVVAGKVGRTALRPNQFSLYFGPE